MLPAVQHSCEFFNYSTDVDSKEMLSHHFLTAMLGSKYATVNDWGYNINIAFKIRINLLKWRVGYN